MPRESPESCALNYMHDSITSMRVLNYITTGHYRRKSSILLLYLLELAYKSSRQFIFLEAQALQVNYGLVDICDTGYECVLKALLYYMYSGLMMILFNTGIIVLF